MIVDTHSHLNFKAFDADRQQVLQRTKDEGVVCIDVGTKYETSVKAVNLAGQNQNIFASIGLHPIHIKTDLLKLRTDEDEGAFAPLGEDFDYEKYKNLSLSNGRVVAIGEIGLDYYYKPKSSVKKEQYKNLQKDVFIKQLDLAQELDLPVIIHCRMAFNDVYEILKSRKLKGVMHCFVGTVEEMEKIVGLGFCIGINGIIFKLDMDEVVRRCPLDKILTETDCPYLTPPQAGKDKRNEPVYVRHVIEKIAELKNVSFAEAAEQTAQNAKNLFKI